MGMGISRRGHRRIGYLVYGVIVLVTVLVVLRTMADFGFF